jgi:hypothetical protein
MADEDAELEFFCRSTAVATRLRPVMSSSSLCGGLRRAQCVRTASATRSCSDRKGGKPYLRFDNAHQTSRRGRFAKRPAAYDHWHRNEADPGRPYAFTSAMQLLDDFWREVKRVMSEKGIPNDL